MRKLALSLSVLAFMASCATMDKVALSDSTIRKPIPPLTLNLGYDVFMLRVDLSRATHEELTLTEDRRERSQQVPNDYTPLVVDLGGGIIVDYNKNVCLDLVRFYGLTDAKSFKILSKGEGFGAQEATYIKKDGTYRIERKGGLRQGVEKGTMTADATARDDKRSKIKIEGDTVTEATLNSLGMRFSSYIKKESDQLTTIKGLFGEVSFVSAEDGVTETSGGTRIEHAGTSVTFKTGGVGNRTIKTMILTDSSLFLFNQDYRGFELRRNGTEAQLFVNGKKQMTYTLVEME